VKDQETPDLALRPLDMSEALFRQTGPSGQAADEEARERIAFLTRRIQEKIKDYERYQFSKHESRALNVFFDLAQEFTGIDDLWALCVIVPKVFFGKEATLYLLNTDNVLEWRCCSEQGCTALAATRVDKPPFMAKPTIIDGHYFIPIKGHHELLAQLPFEPKHDVIGLLDIRPSADISPHEELFFEKYANRIGFRIHNRIIAHTNKDHLRFIKNLVEDIGHNVIVPNMYFKLYYRRLESKIKVLREISGKFSELTGGCQRLGQERATACSRLQREMEYAFEALLEQYQEIYRHYEQTSLFLETLLRRSHFEQGRYVLEMRPCEVWKQIVAPQIERYRPRLEDRGIEVVEPVPPAAALKTMADLGLLSQVVANFFSNAVKYTQPVPGDPLGRKYVSFSATILPGYFGPGRDGLRVEVFSSGPSLPKEEEARLYTEGFRGANAVNEYGTGHGLSFVKEVVGLHHGTTGYEPSAEGNTFFIVLPRQAGDQSATAEPRE